ncbi:MAG: tetratricopeptide repeat protein [Cytophagales bacterium]|nr:tetratricopeptide repeat protein [Cytophagales bacterium]MDW8384899.1 tetratricopeptide repeat protein [Flammeovirgaceae bacterium]
MLIATFAIAQDRALDYYIQAEKLRQENNFRAAIDMYDMAIKADPTNYKYFFQKGKCYILLKDQENAIRCFEKTIELQKDYTQAYFRLGWLYRQKEKYNEAIKYFDLAYQYEADPKERLQYKDNILEILFKLERYQEAGKHIKDAKAVAPNDIRILYFEAKYYNAIGNYEAARAAMDKAIPQLTTESPEEAARYYYELGYALHKLKQYEKANEIFKKANYGQYRSLIAEMTPQYNYNLALAYLKVYEYKKAKELLEYTLSMDPTFTQAHEMMSRIAQANTDRTAVLEHKKTAIATEKDPVRKSARYRELCELQLESGFYDDAIFSADECLKIQPKNYNASFIKALALARKKNYEEAKNILNELIAFPGLDLDTKAQYNFALGLISKTMNDKNLATNAFKAATYGIYRYAAIKELDMLRNGGA